MTAPRRALLPLLLALALGRGALAGRRLVQDVELGVAEAAEQSAPKGKRRHQICGNYDLWKEVTRKLAVNKTRAANWVWIHAVADEYVRTQQARIRIIKSELQPLESQLLLGGQGQDKAQNIMPFIKAFKKEMTRRTRAFVKCGKLRSRSRWLEAQTAPLKERVDQRKQAVQEAELSLEEAELSLEELEMDTQEAALNDTLEERQAEQMRREGRRLAERIEELKQQLREARGDLEISIGTYNAVVEMFEAEKMRDLLGPAKNSSYAEVVKFEAK